MPDRVKRLFSDEALREKLAGRGFFLSSANSINWGRVLPQIVYYISAYCDLLREGRIQKGERINVCVPTGNFGNILAAYYAREMGVPIGRLICASNSNNVLTDFLCTGVYDRNRTFYNTISPSMDILVSSNLERLLYAITGENSMVRDCMSQLTATGRYQVDERTMDKISRLFKGYCCDDEETKRVIGAIYRQFDYLIDPHTARGLLRPGQVPGGDGGRDPRHRGFHRQPLQVLRQPPYRPGRGRSWPRAWDILDQLSEKTGQPVPAPLAALRDKKPRFQETVEKDHMVDAVLEMLK